MSLRATGLGLLVAALLVACAGCGGRSTAGELHHRLLALTDLPGGWSEAPTPGKGAPRVKASCLSSLPKDPQGWSYDISAFEEGTSLPNLVEVLATGPQVRATWQGLAGAISHCRTSTLDLGTTKVEAAIRPPSLPGHTGSSSASAWTFTVEGVRLGFDLVLFRTASYSGYVAYADLGSPRTPTVAAFARAAIAKAASGSTAPVPDTISIASAQVQIAHTSLGTIGYRVVGSGPPPLLITGYSGTMES